MNTKKHHIRSKISSHPNFPKDGIIFRDLNPVYRDTKSFNDLIDILAEEVKPLGDFDHIVMYPSNLEESYYFG